MTHVFLLCIYTTAVLVLSFPAQATHILGGEIQTRIVSCQSFTHEIAVIIYTDGDAVAPQGILSLGSLAPVEASIEDFTSELLEEGTIRWTMRTTQAFPGAGSYQLSFQESNRGRDVVNIPNSENTPFYLESQLVVRSLFCNTPPTLDGVPTFVANVGERYVLPLLASDADGDSLSLELVAPKIEEGYEIDGYRLPIKYDLELLENPVASDGVSAPSLTITHEALVWDAPNLAGQFNINVRVSEWRRIEDEWIPLGYVTRDVTVQVVGTIDDSNVDELLITGTEDAFADPDVFVYPNPTKGILSLEVNNGNWQGAEATLHNIIGETLDKRIIHAGSNAYNLTDFTSGFYFINLRLGEWQQTLRFVKR